MKLNRRPSRLLWAAGLREERIHDENSSQGAKQTRKTP